MNKNRMKKSEEKNNNFERTIKKLIHNKVFLVVMILIVIVLLSIPVIKKHARKNVNIQVFKYEQNDDESIKITGLTDKGKTDSKITIPSVIDGKKVVSIEREAFRDDYCLSEVVFEDGVTSIAENAFLNCTNLNSVTFSPTISDIGTNVFKNTLWEKNQLEQSNEIIVNDILVEVKNDVEEYEVPSNVKSIASGVFYDNAQIKKVTMSKSQVEKIGSFAFAKTPNLTEVYLPDSVKMICYGAFSESGVQDIIIPDNVEQIEPDAFLGVKHISYTKELQGKDWGAESAN